MSNMRTTYTYALLPISLGAFEEIRGLMLSAGYSESTSRDSGQPLIDMRGIAVTPLEVEEPTLKGRERVMAEEPEPCMDVLAGTFTVTEAWGYKRELDFYVRTCKTVDPGDPRWEDVQGKREDDLNEQYTEVAMKLSQLHDGHIHYRHATPDPFF